MPTKTLPYEIYNLIILNLSSPSDIQSCCLVNKTFNEISNKRLYKSIRFTSLEQRSKFFEKLYQKEENLTRVNSSIDLSTAESVHNQPIIRSIDFGLDVDINDDQENQTLKRFNSNDTLYNDKEPPSYGYRFRWSHNFIPELLPLLPSSLTSLSICKAHFSNTAIVETLSKLLFLEYLDVSYSNIRDPGIIAIAELKNLKRLNADGVFQLKRNTGQVLVEVVKGCNVLEVVSVRECSDLGMNIVKEMKRVNAHLKIHK